MNRNEEFRERCLNFGIGIIQLLRRIPDQQRPAMRLRQLEKCGTSIGANVREAQSAQSRPDFISKFEIALKEARETDYWLRLLKATEPALAPDLGEVIGECWQITAILVASIKTAKRNGGIDEPRLRRTGITAENAESGKQKERAESREQN